MGRPSTALVARRLRRTQRLALDEASIRRITVSLVAAGLERYRQASVSPATWQGWGDDLRLDEEGLGFDSLALLDLCTATNEFFHLFESGVEDYLFVRRSLGEWITIIARGLALQANNLGFRTSGSTGQPKLCVHARAALETEIRVLGNILPEARRVVSLVPPHHIYGFLFSVGLPLHIGIPVLEGRALAPAALARLLQPGDILLATPFLWSMVLRNLRCLPTGVTGITSTAPMPGALARALREAGLSRLVEIYGSTETAGIGWRENEAAPFRLFPHWSFGRDEQHLLRRIGPGEPEELTVMDRLEPCGEAGFRPAGRLDDAVQIGGTNVFPARIAATIKAIPGVADCAIRPDGTEATRRLKAFVVPEMGIAIDSLERLLRETVDRSLSAPERPVHYSFGAELPRNTMGKSTDW